MARGRAWLLSVPPVPLRFWLGWVVLAWGCGWLWFVRPVALRSLGGLGCHGSGRWVVVVCAAGCAEVLAGPVCHGPGPCMVVVRAAGPSEALAELGCLGSGRWVVVVCAAGCAEVLAGPGCHDPRRGWLRFVPPDALSAWYSGSHIVVAALGLWRTSRMLTANPNLGTWVHRSEFPSRRIRIFTAILPMLCRWIAGGDDLLHERDSTSSRSARGRSPALPPAAGRWRAAALARRPTVWALDDGGLGGKAAATVIMHRPGVADQPVLLGRARVFARTAWPGRWRRPAAGLLMLLVGPQRPGGTGGTDRGRAHPGPWQPGPSQDLRGTGGTDSNHARPRAMAYAARPRPLRNGRHGQQPCRAPGYGNPARPRSQGDRRHGLNLTA